MARPTRFWANPGTEPKRAYRWLMRFNTNENPLDEWLIKKVSPRPSWSLSETKHSFLNHTFYYPGRIEYDEISVTLVEAVSPNSAENLQNMLELSGYVRPNATAGQLASVSKAGWTAPSPNGAGLNNVEIVQLNEQGNVLETWRLYNTWIKACKFGDLDYESDDMLNVELTLRYDFFTLNQDPASVLDLIGSQIGELFS